MQSNCVLYFFIKYPTIRNELSNTFHNSYAKAEKCMIFFYLLILNGDNPLIQSNRSVIKSDKKYFKFFMPNDFLRIYLIL